MVTPKRIEQSLIYSNMFCLYSRIIRLCVCLVVSIISYYHIYIHVYIEHVCVRTHMYTYDNVYIYTIDTYFKHHVDPHSQWISFRKNAQIPSWTSQKPDSFPAGTRGHLIMGSFHVLFPCIVQGGQSFRSLPSSPSRAPENWDFMVSMTAWIVKSWPFPQLTFRPSQFCGLEDDLPKIGTRKFQALNVGEVWGKHGSFVAQYPGNIQHCMDADGPLVSHLYDQVETLDFQTCWRWQQNTQVKFNWPVVFEVTWTLHAEKWGNAPIMVWDFYRSLSALGGYR